MPDSNPPFEGFPKIPRLSRPCVITEKIDGTNAQICITEDGDILAGSRTRWLGQSNGHGKVNDNYGFYAWVQEHRHELIRLGPGRHFGEWWGQGIQRGYGLNEKRFSLFNVSRWGDPESRPDCVGVVPTLYVGEFTIGSVNSTLTDLAIAGSYAAPGYADPEGIVVFHTASSTMFKKTIVGDDAPKNV